jgi:hypothetical protein
MNQPLAQSILIVCVAAGLIQPLLLAQTPVSGQAAQQSGKSPVKVFIRFLEYKLADIRAVVAAELLAKLQAVTIVLDLSHGKLRSMQYHPSAGWLEANGYATNLVKCVHIPEAADLPTPSNITEQPWVVLHELAHAYHDQVLGFEEPRILKAYEDFKRSGRGNHALLYDGSRVRHYALTDQKEFFAEMTESYFGVNDFFPFNRAELMTAEPEIYELMQAIWGPVAGRGSRLHNRGVSPLGSLHAIAFRHASKGWANADAWFSHGLKKGDAVGTR